MKKFLNWKLLLFLITVLAFILRFYKLGIIPTGLHADEAYLGYNAFSILNTAREMTGNLLPIHLVSFLYTPAGYVYSSIPFVALFGLSEFSVRFSSAFFGSLTPILVFFLVSEIFVKWKNKEVLALVSALFLAISPWHINLSRVATDNILVVFFIILGSLLYLKWLKNPKIFLLIFSFLCFLFTIFTYHASRSFLPLFIPLLFIIFAPKDYKKKLIIPTILFVLLIIIPVLYVLLSPTLSYRIKSLSIFQNPETQLVLSEQLREDGVMRVQPIEARIFHNKIVNYSQTAVQNYLKHFSYEFLFTDAGLPARYRVPNAGLLYLFDLPFILLGAYMLLNKDKRLGIFLIGWTLLAPVGSAFTFDDVPNLQRTLIMLPSILILSAIGFLEIFSFLKNIKKAKYLGIAFCSVLIILMFYCFLYYLHSYYVHLVDHRPWFRDEGYKELVTDINKFSPNYKNTVITNVNGGPTIFLFFFNRTNPKLVQQILKKANTTNYGNISFDKYAITDDSCPLKEVVKTDPITFETTTILQGKKGTLYVNAGTCNIPKKGVKVLSVVKRGDSSAIFELLSIEQ